MKMKWNKFDASKDGKFEWTGVIIRPVGYHSYSESLTPPTTRWKYRRPKKTFLFGRDITDTLKKAVKSLRTGSIKGLCRTATVTIEKLYRRVDTFKMPELNNGESKVTRIVRWTAKRYFDCDMVEGNEKQLKAAIERAERIVRRVFKSENKETVESLIDWGDWVWRGMYFRPAAIIIRKMRRFFLPEDEMKRLELLEKLRTKRNTDNAGYIPDGADILI